MVAEVAGDRTNDMIICRGIEYIMYVLLIGSCMNSILLLLVVSCHRDGPNDFQKSMGA